MKQKMLLVVDTDTGFVKRFKRKLDVEGIADKFFVHMVEPDTTIEVPKLMAQQVVSEVGRIVAEEDVCAIFVDLVVYETSPFDTDGILIAEELSRAFPGVPIFSISAKADDSRHMDHFAEATLGNCDGVFPKSFLDGPTFSAKRLTQILRRGFEKRQSRSASTPADQQTAAILPAVSNAFNVNSLEPRVAAQIEELGSAVFWGLVERMMPNAQGVISYVAPGASGAYVFKATVKFQQPGTSATKAKQFLLKISTRGDEVRREASNHNDLKKSAPRKYFPSLLHESPVSIEGTSGIAYEFESEHETLLTYLSREMPKGSVPIGFGRRLVDILKEIYGDPRPKVTSVWSDCYPLSKSVRTKLLGYLAENKPLVGAMLGNDSLERVVQFILHGGETLRPIEREIDTRHIHGDFNCGNILVSMEDRQTANISLIDFGARKQDHVVRDIAKLERDIVFRIVDWGSPQFHEPGRIPIWRSFLRTIQPGAIFDPAPVLEDCDPGVTSAEKLIYELRSAIRDIDLEGTEDSYQMALLHYSLLAILHPRISTAKKAFAVEYARNILGHLER